ncbi:MAG: SMC-Scp complex subunit ScpB [bacterium]|nr:SMC-Scp complex subunit ScpB [bacterium]
MTDDKIAQLEALLFYHGEAVTFKRIASVLKTTEKEAEELVLEYEKELRGRERGGFALLLDKEKVQLVTKSELHSIFEKLAQEDLQEELTPASLETLAIIAYLGPLSRPEIDYVRGVNSSFMLRNLFLRGLVERKKGVKKGGAFAYSTSFDFLKHIGLEDVSKLPEYERYHSVLEKMRRQESPEVISNL